MAEMDIIEGNNEVWLARETIVEPMIYG